MTFTSLDENLLKVDGRGRVRMPAEKREALLDEFERSGLSALRFSGLAGVKYPTFALWVKKRREARAQSSHEPASAGSPLGGKPRPVQFLEVTPMTSSPSAIIGGLKIELPGGAQLSLESPAHLPLAAELLRLLHVNGARSC